MQKIGGFIAKERKAKSLTQKELAAMLNITDKAVSKWERGLSLPDISMLNPLSECLGVSVSELLNGERDVTSTNSAVELNSVITYAQHSSHSINISFRRMVGTIFSVVMMLGMIVCMICNFAVTGALTWSLYPISSVIFVWTVTFPLIVHQQKGMLISLCLFTVLICPFIWVLSRLTGVGMVFGAGWRISAAVILYLWIGYVIMKIWSKRKWFAAGIAIFGGIILCVVINLIVAALFAAPVTDVWDILAYVIMCILAVGCLVYDKIKQQLLIAPKFQK